ncbi:MAG: hypothetical protein DRI86_09590 [Bacteroidetes bacterium]|nr:MAG: hypothetical protein DRI86_09590 [Bacteroidota bacterium]
MINKLLTLVFLFGIQPIFAQQISLDSCVAAAERNWPSFKKEISISQKRDLIEQTLKKNYLPKINLSGQLSYQSEVITFPEVQLMPDFFAILPQDNYSVGANISQTIWDGGITSTAKDIQMAQNNVEAQQLNVETYGLIGKINKLYVSYLFLKKSEKIINISEGEIDENIQSIASAVKNGVITSSELNNIEAEKLKLQKQQIEIQSSISLVLSSLSMITGLQLDTNYKFELPTSADIANKGIRPEIELLNAQKKLSMASTSQYKTSRMPKFVAFGNVGYGRPGYDMLNTDMHGYYMIGAKFTWDVWDWNASKNNEEKVKLQTLIIEDNISSMEKQIAIEENEFLQEMDRYTKLIKLDEDIELLKESVYKNAQSKMKNGSLTSTEYLKIFNEWKRSKLSTELDRINLIKSNINYKHSLGLK